MRQAADALSGTCNRKNFQSGFTNANVSSQVKPAFLTKGVVHIDITKTILENPHIASPTE